MNAAVIVALITALAAIVAPMITAWLNNRHQLKMNQFELYDQKKVQVINDYISAVAQYLESPARASESKMAEVRYLIYLYSPKSTWKDIDLLDGYISSNRLDSARDMLPELTKKLSPSVLASNDKSK